MAPNPRGELFLLAAPDRPAALAHYFFAARAGDPAAAMALAHRHAHGHGVVRSCQTAALYYRPVAERVLEAARAGAIPQSRGLRLSHKTAAPRSKPSSEQEFLHYQWFADFGNAEAARAVAHLLSHGEVRDFGAAVRYLEQAAGAGDADAMAHLGHMHANGLAVERDNATAWRWFWRAAEKGALLLCCVGRRKRVCGWGGKLGWAGLARQGDAPGDVCSGCSLPAMPTRRPSPLPPQATPAASWAWGSCT